MPSTEQPANITFPWRGPHTEPTSVAFLRKTVERVTSTVTTALVSIEKVDSAIQGLSSILSGMSIFGTGSSNPSPEEQSLNVLINSIKFLDLKGMWTETYAKWLKFSEYVVSMTTGSKLWTMFDGMFNGRPIQVI